MNIGITWARGSGSTLKGKNKYPLHGRPLIYWPLMSLKKSRTVDMLYVFTEDDEIAEYVQAIGWRVIPRPSHLVSYSDKRFSMQGAWRLITEHVANDLDLPLPDFCGDWITMFHLLSDTAFSLNCNNCMLRSVTFSGMYRLIAENNWPAVYPAARVDGQYMLGHPDGYLFPIWHCQGLNRQYYPPLYKPLLNTGFTRATVGIPGRPTHYYYEIDAIEAMDVHDRMDIEILEAFLERNPDYFGFQDAPQET